MITDIRMEEFGIYIQILDWHRLIKSVSLIEGGYAETKRTGPKVTKRFHAQLN